MFILSDLQTIIAQKDTYSALSENEQFSSVPEYAKFQQSHYKIAPLIQAKLYKLGISDGECLGFTYMMANPKLSPYSEENHGKNIDLTQAIHDYQKNQRHRKKDLQDIKSTRLTREYFCPSLKEQAEKIWAFAENKKNTDLGLDRRAKAIRHISYVSMSDEKLRYADSNHGVYLFDNKQDFIEFYIAAGKIDKKRNLDYHFYQFKKMEYTSNLTSRAKPSTSLTGKLRTFFTGNKYNDSNFISNYTSGIGLTAVGTVIGAVIGTAVLPILGTLVGALIGASIAGILDICANKKGHHGALGVPHLLMDTAYDIKESILNPTELKLKQEEHPELPSSLNDITASGSYTSMLTIMPSNNSLISAKDDVLPSDMKTQTIITTEKENQPLTIPTQQSLFLLSSKSSSSAPEDDANDHSVSHSSL